MATKICDLPGFRGEESVAWNGDYWLEIEDGLYALRWRDDDCIEGIFFKAESDAKAVEQATAKLREIYRR